MLFGPMRFSDLRCGLPTISPNVLSQRLRDLKADGIHIQGLADPPLNSALLRTHRPRPEP
jgi:hypothetical protein